MPATPPVEHRPATAATPALEIHRSPRRRRSASAAPRDQTVVVRLPLGMPASEEERLIAELVRKVTGAGRAAARGSDAALERRAVELADRYLDGVRATSVRWSPRMRRRYGSCTPTEGTIRISTELATAPGYVLDHVLLHELVHLRVPDHGRDFHVLLGRDPHADRAAGWLEGYTAGRLASGVAGLVRPEAAPGAPAAPAAVGDAAAGGDELVDEGALS